MFLKLSIDVVESPNGGFEPVIKISGLLDVVNGSDDLRDKLIKLFLERNGDSLLAISYSNSGSEVVIRRAKYPEAAKMLRENYEEERYTAEDVSYDGINY